LLRSRRYRGGAGLSEHQSDDGATTATSTGTDGRNGTLEVSGVSVRFGGLTALDDVSVTVPPASVVGVIGPNGAGKTTLFNVICGFVRPDAGTIAWDGQTLGRIRPDRLVHMGISRTLQGVGLFPGLSVVENVMAAAGPISRARLGWALLGLPPSDRSEGKLRAAAMEALDELGVADIAQRSPSTLPYPVQKRVALARALVARPRLLLLDEPAGGLGSDEIAELCELIRGLGESMAVMLVEHHMDLVMEACDRVVVLDFGRLIASGTPAEVQDDPRVVEAYLGVEAQAAQVDQETERAGG